VSEFYLSNPLLKKANIPISFTEEHVEEHIKCANDVTYFVENYVKIVNVDRGLIPFEMYDYQRKMVETFSEHRFVIAKMPRQSGKSTTVTSYILWKILFQENQNVAILANKGRLANDLLEKVKLAYENLPKWMQQGVVIWNKGNIELENGSKVLASATSSSAIRGGSYNLLLLDEFAFVPRNIAETFFASVYPTISSGKSTQIIIVSTPYGMNHYYKMWTDAIENRSLYVPIEVHWSDIPGRDDKWREETIKNTSEEQFRQEFECQFIGSTNTLINPVKLRAMAFVTPKRDKVGVDIYEEPIPNHIYVMTVDTAHGVGMDYSAFVVIDVTQIPYKLVAKFRSNTISPMIYPEVIALTGQKYNTAHVLGETNDVGQMVIESLHRDLEYENVLTTVNKNRMGQRVNPGFVGRSAFGVKTTNQVKRIGCSNLKDMVDSDKILIQDFDVIEELSTFVQKGSSYQAEEGHHDDLVMSLVLFGWLIRQQVFRDLSNTDVRHKLAQERYAELMDDLLPAGFVDDGQIEDPDEIESLDMFSTNGFWNPRL